MSNHNQIQTRLAAFFAAAFIAFAANGSLLLGFDHLASQGDAALAAAQSQTTVAAHQDGEHAAL